MDRFIDVINLLANYNTEKFKIQYGQIYRQGSGITSDIITDLKSNMDRFIVQVTIL